MDPYLWLLPVFFAIALVLSMLGMGGAQLYIPLLFWSGMDFKTEAVPLGMLLNVISSGSAAGTGAAPAPENRARARGDRPAAGIRLPLGTQERDCSLL